MKKKVFLVMSALLVFGLAIAVYAFNTAGSVDASTKAACCCCPGDTCPMKDKNAAAATDKAAAHDGCEYCKDGGDACPMKKGDAAAGEMKMEGGMKPDMKMANGEMCPMMKGDANHKMEGGMKHEMKADGSCACCKHAKEKKADPAI